MPNARADKPVRVMSLLRTTECFNNLRAGAAALSLALVDARNASARISREHDRRPRAREAKRRARWPVWLGKRPLAPPDGRLRPAVGTRAQDGRGSRTNAASLVRYRLAAARASIRERCAGGGWIAGWFGRPRGVRRGSGGGIAGRVISG